MILEEKKREIAKKLMQVNDESLLEQVEELLKSSAVEKNHPNVPEFGRLKGKIRIAPDFDEPLEDFKEYM